MQSLMDAAYHRARKQRVGRLNTKFATREDALAYALGRAGRTLPIAKTVSQDGLFKAHILPNGNVLVEGFISTPLQDIEKDIMEPEAFSPGLQVYMKKGAPISVEHNTRVLPVGFLTQSRLVRDSGLIDLAENPTNPPTMDYQYYTGGTGWYGQGVIYDDAAKRVVINGTVSSFSWIGLPKTWEDLPGKGRRFSKKGSIDPIMEVTLTAYPINQAATMRIAKAGGYLPSLTRAELYEAVLNNAGLAEELTKIFAPGIPARARDRSAWVVQRFTNPEPLETPKFHDYFTKE